MRYIWKVIHLIDSDEMEEALNAAEMEGWEVFATSKDCIVVRQLVLHQPAIGGTVGQAHRQNAKH